MIDKTLGKSSVYQKSVWNRIGSEMILDGQFELRDEFVLRRARAVLECHEGVHALAVQAVRVADHSRLGYFSMLVLNKKEYTWLA